jgi:hypothetical protein
MPNEYSLRSVAAIAGPENREREGTKRTNRKSLGAFRETKSNAPALFRLLRALVKTHTREMHAGCGKRKTYFKEAMG